MSNSQPSGMPATSSSPPPPSMQSVFLPEVQPGDQIVAVGTSFHSVHDSPAAPLKLYLRHRRRDQRISVNRAPMRALRNRGSVRVGVAAVRGVAAGLLARNVVGGGDHLVVRAARPVSSRRHRHLPGARAACLAIGQRRERSDDGGGGPTAHGPARSCEGARSVCSCLELVRRSLRCTGPSASSGELDSSLLRPRSSGVLDDRQKVAGTRSGTA